MKIILASASPRRAALLKQIGLSFDVQPSDIDESFNSNDEPEKIVQKLAAQKAEHIASIYGESFIIAADTMVFLDGKNLGKPDDYKTAKKMLQSLSGNTHDVYTGVCLIRAGKHTKKQKRILFFERTKVTFATLTDQEIERYIRNEHPFDKAGSYGIQDDLGALFVKHLNGDYYNVVGFPLHAFYQNIKNHFPEILNQLFKQSS